MVADASTDKSKKPAKQAPAATKNDTIIFHLYLPITVTGDKAGDKGFSAEDYFSWIEGPVDQYDSGRWSNEGISLEHKTDSKSGVAEFKKSLQRKGAVVVYLGHSTLDQYNGNNSMGLTPQGKSTPEIPNATLRTLLSKSAASLVIIASCDSKTSVGKITDGPPVIVTNSGADKMTNTTHWAQALGAFFFLLIGLEIDSKGQPSMKRKAGHATINDALAASADAFKAAGTGDRFELANGDGTIVLFP